MHCTRYALFFFFLLFHNTVCNVHIKMNLDKLFHSKKFDLLFCFQTAFRVVHILGNLET